MKSLWAEVTAYVWKYFKNTEGEAGWVLLRSIKDVREKYADFRMQFVQTTRMDDMWLWYRRLPPWKLIHVFIEEYNSWSAIIFF